MTIHHVAVIGAGVIGLSTAIKAQQKGFQVTIIADALPGDTKSIHYTSPWAGAHHVGYAANDAKAEMEKETFNMFWDMSTPGNEAEGCFMRITQTEYYEGAFPLETNDGGPHPMEALPAFRHLTPNECPHGVTGGVAFTTVSIDTATYLPYLLALFLGKGGKVVRARVQHIDQVLHGAFCTAPHATFLCAGIGARFLGGVEDKDVYPIRGQTVLLRAPWINFGRTQYHANNLDTYIIPRRSGDVIVGGTRTADDWFPYPRPETTADILRRGLALCPELIPPTLRDDKQHQPTVADLEAIVIEPGCGFRPGRHGGIRLELEYRSGAGHEQVPVIHNYGHAGAGYQTSWGSATMALRLFESSKALPPLP